MVREGAAAGWPAATAAVAHTFADELDDTVRVEGPDGHHLQRVRRLDVGERITVADGAGTWREYAVAATGKGTLTLRAEGDLRVEPRATPAVALAFALTKGEQPEAVVRMVTELGVDRILPVVSVRSQVRWAGPRALREHERLGRVTREAASQSRRAWLPEVLPLGDLAALAGHPDIAVGDREGGSASALPLPPGGEWLGVVGPEGGLTADERRTLGGRAVGLGPHVLRAGTAAVALAAALEFRRRAPDG
jgi:16S rRNA (uracil1498-N3)-methyltransferase